MMGLLLIVALVLAIPTYGLSIVLWLVISYFKAKAKVEAKQMAQGRRVVLAPLFDNQHGDFFRALDLPMMHGYTLDSADAERCGQHVASFLAHNPTQADLFLLGVMDCRLQKQDNTSNAIDAARFEAAKSTKGNVHLVAYRAIETIMANNTGLNCFISVDFGRIIERRAIQDLRAVTAS